MASLKGSEKELELLENKVQKEVCWLIASIPPFFPSRILAFEFWFCAVVEQNLTNCFLLSNYMQKQALKDLEDRLSNNGATLDIKQAELKAIDNQRNQLSAEIRLVNNLVYQRAELEMKEDQLKKWNMKMLDMCVWVIC